MQRVSVYKEDCTLSINNNTSFLYIATDKENEHLKPTTASIVGEDIHMIIPENNDLWELMTETADQLYSFVSAE